MKAFAAGGEVVAGETAAARHHRRRIALPGVSAAAQLIQLDLAGYRGLAGSACASGAMKTEPRPRRAMGVAPRHRRRERSASVSGLRRREATSTHSSPTCAADRAQPGDRPHDLSRLSGDHAARARSAEAMLPWCSSSIRQSAQSRRPQGRRRSGGDRGRPQAGRSALLQRRAGQLSLSPAGATEALNWAMKGSFERRRRRTLVTLATEHAAVLDTAEWLSGQGLERTVLPVGRDGLVDLDAPSGRSTAGTGWSRRCWSITRSA